MSLASFPPVRDGVVRVPARGAVPELVHVLDEDSIAAVEMALATGRPLLEVSASSWPLVIFTTNEERTLPDAFLRRCLVLHLRVPEVRDELITWLEARGRAHFRDCAPEVLRKAAELLAHDQEKYQQQNLAPPGVAEYIDLLRGVTRRRPGDVAAQLELLIKVGKFVLCKHPGALPR
jgi:hypothetical protein